MSADAANPSADGPTALVPAGPTQLDGQVRYHRPRESRPLRPVCRTFDGDGQQVPVAGARAHGLKPCQNCYPEVGQS